MIGEKTAKLGQHGRILLGDVVARELAQGMGIGRLEFGVKTCRVNRSDDAEQPRVDIELLGSEGTGQSEAENKATQHRFPIIDSPARSWVSAKPLGATGEGENRGP